MERKHLPIIAGNWKMNTTVAEAVTLVKALRNTIDNVSGVEKVVCPPFISLVSVAEALRGSSIKVGAQNMHFEEKGAYTGEIAPPMLVGLCQFVILGHSERRQYFGETDESVNRKLQAAFKVGLQPILCVGESLEQREAGHTEEVVTRQVKGALHQIPFHAELVMAYEPIWAIGTGRAATGQDAKATIGLIRKTLAQLYGAAQAERLRIQYGGSVTPANIAEFLAHEEIDGALVGGASLKAADFLSIAEQAARLKGVK